MTEVRHREVYIRTWHKSTVEATLGHKTFDDHLAYAFALGNSCRIWRTIGELLMIQSDFLPQRASIHGDNQ